MLSSMLQKQENPKRILKKPKGSFTNRTSTKGKAGYQDVALQ